MKEDMGDTCGTHRMNYKFVVEDDNIKTDLQETGCDDVGWIYLA
jgi:hypothetical protein